LSINSIIERKSFWECLFYLEQLDEDVRVDFVLEDLEIDEKELKTALNFLNILNQDYDTYEKNYVSYIKVPQQKQKVNISFTPAEWISLQLHFPLMEEFSHHSFHHKLRFELSKLEEEHKHLDAQESFNELDLITTESKEPISGIQIESENLLKARNAVNKKCLLRVKTTNNKVISLFPRRIVNLDGVLNVIGEDDQDRCLINICFHQIKSVEIDPDLHFTPNLSNIEIDDFIEALRSVNDNEIRVVLKIKNKDINFKEPNFQYIKNPYLISNSDGDFIWAASMEMNSDLLDWLNSYHDEVEIMNPKILKVHYDSYVKKLNKKAS
jgi:hypothetical protein